MVINVHGQVVLEARDNQGKLIDRRENKNLLVTLGKAFVAQTLMATTGYSVGLTYCAIGTGITTPALADTQLTTEVARKAVSTRTVASNVLTISTLFTIAESTYYIKEVGIFGHTDATSSANSGKLFAHALLDYDNSGGSNNITIIWTITVG